MAHENIPELPVFDATIQVRVYKFEDVMNREILAKVLQTDDKASVT
jgi:hypothetical protein